MMSKISAWILRWFGWRLVSHNERLPRKCIVAVVPHTSNWDFPLGLLVRSAMREPIGFVAKDSLFRGPLGPVMRWMGGHPVDRSKKSNFVEAVADIFRREDEFLLSIAPEGTRKRVEQLRTGFYYIAKAAGVPLILCRFDWGNHIVEFSAPFWPTEDKERDFAFIYAYFRGVKGYHPKHSFLQEEPRAGVRSEE